MTRTMCDVLLLNSVATNYPTTYKGESVIELLEILFTEHEVQLKTIKQQCLEEAEPKYEQYFSLLSDFTSLEVQLKVKDEEIEGLKAECIKLNHYKEHFEYVEETYVRY